MLSKEQGKVLLKIAKDAIKGHKNIPNYDFLKQKRGVFVTLTKKGALRGCIGFPYPTQQLGEATYYAAKSAAYEDPRFPPLSNKEINEIDIEVSVLSKPKHIKLKDIKKGDGVILEKDGRSALFLPQVWEQIPNKIEFLKQLSMKAFLSPESYKEARYKVFNVQIFK